MICIQIYRTGTRMGESQKLATGKDPPDQASAVKCSTPKPRRQKKTGTSSFCFGSPDPKCKNYLAINTIRALLPPILAHFLHRWPPGGCHTQPTVSGYQSCLFCRSSPGLSQPTSILKSYSIYTSV